MNKKIVLFVSLIVLVGLGVFVCAVLSEINPQKSTSLNSGNGICEYYQNEFSIGDVSSILINGETLDIGYLGNKKWKVNDYKGELKGHDFFVYNSKSKLKGVRFDFSYMSQNMPEGNFGLTEQDYYPWDCQGYSSSTGLISEIYIEEGWNLLPFGTSLRECYYALENELCVDNVLVKYYYIPTMSKYISEKELEEQQDNQKIKEFFSEGNEFTLMSSSQWIYVKPGAGNKKVIGDFGGHIPNRNKIFSGSDFKLSKGWNFLFVNVFMIYDDSWNENRMSVDDMKGNCNIEKAFFFNPEKQDWVEIPLEDNLDTKMIGMGFIIKVSNDCTLGTSTGDGTSPPGLPLPEPCTDSDEGIVIDVKGTVTDEASGNAIYEDTCTDLETTDGSGGWTPTTTGNILVEYYCGQNNYQYNYFDCLDEGFTSCQDGRCI